MISHTDSLSGKGTKVVTKRASGMLACGSYGIKGTAGELGGYDAVLIPGALKTDNTPIKAGCQAGGSQGLVSATGTTQKTVCCKYISSFRAPPYPTCNPPL